MIKTQQIRSFVWLFFVFLAACDVDRKTDDRINIIHIMADDLGYGEVGFTGSKVFSTPNIDELAAEGVVLQYHYAGSPLCSPSRYSLITGKHAGTSRAITNGGNVLSPEIPSIGQVLKSAGYTTGFFGKWALGAWLDKESSYRSLLKLWSERYVGGHPLANGFDTFLGYDDQTNAHNYFPEFLNDGAGKLRLIGNIKSKNLNVPSKREVYAPDIIHARTLSFIRDSADQPFFMMIHHTLPHLNSRP